MGAPPGQDARTLIGLARDSTHGLIHVALDDNRTTLLEELIGFFAPDIEVITFPAWDCLPYDRVSPKMEIVGRRIDALSRLGRPAESRNGPLIVLTTINAALQRVPSPTIFAEASLNISVGARLDPDELQRFLGKNGYARAHTVREPGEYAIRGGIIDLYPPASDAPIRIDLFGDEIDSLRLFDPVSQRTTDKIEQANLVPITELFLDDASIQRFRSGYRSLFGAINDSDPLYEAVSSGRKHPGMEHWLSLFHAELTSLFAYLPRAVVSFDPQSDAARESRQDQITDFYDARRAMMDQKVKDGASAGALYRPVPPGHMYLMQDDFAHALAGRDTFSLTTLGASAAATHEGAVRNAGAKRGRDFGDIRALPDGDVFAALKEYVDRQFQSNRRFMLVAYSHGSLDRLQALMADHGLPSPYLIDHWQDAEKQKKSTWLAGLLSLDNGFEAEDLAVVTEQDLLGDRLTRRRKKRRRSDKFLLEVSGLSEGDLLVHAEHGIGRFEGLITIDVGGSPHDCLKVIYDGGDKLFVPVENIDVLSRFGSDEATASLDKLGGAGWQARRARVKKRLKDMAEELVRIAAAREVRTAKPITPPAGAYDEFAAKFPYDETDDQASAIEDTLGDLAKGKPMDRLICGDVGFGKTEVAIRAAYAVAMSGQQVAIVVPTTLLCRQHYQNVKERFAGLPIKVRQLSRLVGAKETKEIKAGLADGTVDVVVGTHSILAKSIEFDRLGMLIVDEEQRFGVRQKERLKQIRDDVHVLTLTATPIPRTLQLSLTGVRDLSLITTAPVDRLAVRTFVLPFDSVIIREALMREHFRGGQSFYVCPRIEDLDKVSRRIREMAPELRLVMAHGQMAASELEDVMDAYDRGEYDVLLATNIIEAGLDIPNANTLIVHRADMFGLAQLYQIRGRVGRSKVRGYAYMTYAPDRKLTPQAEKRLQVLETLDTLGAGFTLASYDLDIRGAGNLLGEEQSGHIKEVGIELYQQMLREAVEEARNGGAVEDFPSEGWSPQINLGMPVMIPESYVQDLNVRLSLYRRIGDQRDVEDIDSFAAEMVDRFGPLPVEVENLLGVITIKNLCRTANVSKLDAGPKGAMIGFHQDRFPHVDRLMDYINKQRGMAKLRPDQRLVFPRMWEDRKQRLAGVTRILQELADLAVG
ncbi:MAG: transcription-repair coupling factor [Alphaproteobacteria bacterium]|nr:transcription-repair coupling factor [Alphaproteobacteria bacterium]MAS45977.1 transcription-repair coupling factor [Alphaproteobacteria bacterium]MAX95841.1 transcription-repair coupling factor [Alphaproteobacteria bacterium]MBN54025.1 transcription-repair coupling factor [Alphaproteobacteria bacterium]